MNTASAETESRVVVEAAGNALVSIGVHPRAAMRLQAETLAWLLRDPTLPKLFVVVERDKPGGPLRTAVVDTLVDPAALVLPFPIAKWRKAARAAIASVRREDRAASA